MLHRVLKVTHPPMVGNDVADLQRVLADQNILRRDLAPGPVDAAFGDRTAAACHRAKYFLGWTVGNLSPIATPSMAAQLIGKAKRTPHQLLFARLRAARHPLHPDLRPPFVGIDVSNNNGGIDWTAVARDGVRFAYAKVTEGLTFVDAYWPSNRDGARGHATPIGGYHFAHPGSSQSGRAQADHFCNHLGQHAGMLRPVIDWEAKGCGEPSQARTLETMVNRIHDRTGVLPMIYGDPWTLRQTQVPAGSIVAHCPLWIAVVGLNEREGPAPYPVRPWTSVAVHQFDWHARVGGVPGDCDMDRSHVPLSTLRG